MLLLAAMVLVACATDEVTSGGSAPADRLAERTRMVAEQIEPRGITSPRVLTAMRSVPRHLFVPADQRMYAYRDHPLPIGSGQTISQPYIVAYMTDVLEVRPSHKVLEIGTGSGYQAAVLAELAREVYSIEIVPELAASARIALAEAGYDKVHLREGDGYRGWPEEAPFDRIIVTAAPDHVPPALVEQLAVGGRMVIPVGSINQEIIVITKNEKGVTQKRTLPVRFVPMTGEAERVNPRQR